MPLYGKTKSGLLLPVTLGGPIMAAPAGLLLDTYPNAAFAYSFRKLRTAYAGSAVRIRRSSDSTELDVGFSGDDFDAAAAAAFIGGGSGFGVTWYDQSGNSRNVVQATAADQMAYAAAGVNNLPSFVGAEGKFLGLTGITITGNDRVTTSVAIENSEVASFGRYIIFAADGETHAFNNDDSFDMSTGNGSTDFTFAFNGVNPSAASSWTDEVPLIAGFTILADGTMQNYKNGSAGATGAGGATPSLGDTASTIYIGRQKAANSASFIGHIGEAVVWGSLPDIAAIQTDQAAYWT